MYYAMRSGLITLTFLLGWNLPAQEKGPKPKPDKKHFLQLEIGQAFGYLTDKD